MFILFFKKYTTRKIRQRICYSAWYSELEDKVLFVTMGLGEERGGNGRGWRKGGDKENYQKRAEEIGKGDYGMGGGGDIMGKGGNAYKV